MNRLVCILAIGSLLALSSCSSVRRLRNRDVSGSDSSMVATAPAAPAAISPDSPLVVGPFPDAVASSPAGVPELADDSKMVMPFWMVPLSYTTFSGKAKAHIESPEESRDFTLNVRIESGKRIWMSVVGSALGISMEAFRAILTPDSMVAVNRIDKEVIRAPFSELAALFPVEGDFYALEAVLTGAKVPALNDLSAVSVHPQTGDVLLKGSSDTVIQSLTFARSDSTMIRQELVQSGLKTELGYSDYVPVGGRRFARSRQIKLTSEGGVQTLTLDFTSFAFDEAVDMPLPIPEKYKQR